MPADSESVRQQGIPSAFRLATSDDWRALLRTRANVLVSGPQIALSAFIYAAQDEMREPIRSVNGSALSLCEGRTLILLDADALDGSGQRRLIQWMDEPRNAGTQIISLAPIPLAPLVQTHRFAAELYYRLNVIYLEVLDSLSRLN
jgi:hypothetical protein